MAITKGYEHTQFFIDDGYSGTCFDRPALKQLEEAIIAGCICAVLVKDVSRLGQNYLKVGYYIEDFFLKHSVRFISVSEDIDSCTNSGDFLPLYSVMDKWYAKDISRKMRMMYQSRVAIGMPIGRPVYGYRKSIGNPKYWEQDPEAVQVIQIIYQLSLMGYGVEQIAASLEKECVLTPSSYHFSKSQKYGGVKTNDNPYKWASSTITQVLEKQEYCGDVINLKTYSHSFKDKKRHPNKRENMLILKNIHEPIIERSIWEYIQQKRNQQKTRKKARKQILFSGFLRCGGCGSNLHYHFNQKNPSIEYYSCSNYIGNRGTCPNTYYVRLDFLTEKILFELNQFIQKAKADWPAFSEFIAHKKEAEGKRAGKNAN